MIHEKQVRQLCAIHTVNNLLQLPSDLDYDTYGGERDRSRQSYNGDEGERKQKIMHKHEWTCRGRILYQFEQSPVSSTSDGNAIQEIVAESAEKKKKSSVRRWRAATQREFDDIASEFTILERKLISGDESAFMSYESSIKAMASTHDDNRLSLMERIRSQYGTPYVGNYSIEVIRESLKRRNVELEFYRVPDDTMRKVTLDAGKDANDSAPSTSNKNLIGFVVYNKEVAQSRTLSLMSWMGSRIPIIKHFCEVGQHWYTITAVRYKHHTRENSFEARSDNGKVDLDYSTWYLIDSQMSGMTTFHTDKDLLGFMRDVQQEGGLLFCAVHTQL
ncbi:hypothetical protein ACHAW5_000130 [Stephanodiscus triporus]|uniref:ubiquitinyl hydrolase 1 n=1 Tax=Stephanodiscus triporus TaxID=2934178 RepID=A0ABD3MR91_9STRA